MISDQAFIRLPYSEQICIEKYSVHVEQIEQIRELMVLAANRI